MPASDINLPLWLAFLSINEQATRDWLTSLRNRRYFEETLTDHIEAASRYGRKLSLVLFDIDDFKKINDTHGHETGDAVLKRFAALLKDSARKADIVCRYGGDEFAVILPETGKADAEKFVERIIGGSMSPLTADNEDVVPPAYLVTAGIAALPSVNLVSEADADLLARKKESRQSPSR